MTDKEYYSRDRLFGLIEQIIRTIDIDISFSVELSGFEQFPATNTLLCYNKASILIPTTNNIKKRRVFLSLLDEILVSFNEADFIDATFNAPDLQANAKLFGFINELLSDEFNFGERLKLSRELSLLFQFELAERTDLMQKTISVYENGKFTPNLKSIKMLISGLRLGRTVILTL